MDNPLSVLVYIVYMVCTHVRTNAHAQKCECCESMQNMHTVTHRVCGARHDTTQRTSPIAAVCV